MEAGENQKQVSTGSHTPLEISPKARDSHFPTAPTTASVLPKTKAKAKPKTKGGGLTAASLCFTKRTDHVINKTGQLDLLTTSRSRDCIARANLGDFKPHGGQRLPSRLALCQNKPWLASLQLQR